jgi:uncharacterized membrane protein
MIGEYSMLGGLGGGMLLVTIFWVAVIAVIFWGLISMSRIQRSAAEPDAQQISKRRYARRSPEVTKPLS